MTEVPPSVVVVHDDSFLGEAVLDALESRGVRARTTDWTGLDLRSALGVVAVSGCRCTSSAKVVEDMRCMLDEAMAQGARVVHVDHAGALGASDGEARNATHFALPDSKPYFHHPYLRSLEVFRAIESGHHVVPVFVGLCIDEEGRTDWGLEQALAEWDGVLECAHRAIDVAMMSTVAGGIAAALQQGRAGRRYVLGGRDRPASEVARALGWRPSEPSLDINWLVKATEMARRVGFDAWALVHGLEPLIYGAALDSRRARAELGYVPRAPLQVG